MKFGEKNSYGIFLKKWKKKTRKKNDKKDMLKFVDVLPKSCWRRVFSAKSLWKPIGSIGSASSERNLGSAMVKTRKVKQQMGQMKEEVSNQDVS